MGYNFPTSPTEGFIHWIGENERSYVFTNGVWSRRAGTALPKNYLTNPAFQISDQNNLTDGSNVASLVMAEQWYAYYVLSDGVYRGQRLALPTPGGSKHRLRMSMTTADTAMVAGEWLALGIILEGNRMADFNFGNGAAASKWGVLRFGCKAPAGTYNVILRNSAVTRSFISPFTVPAALANVDHVQVMVIPPCNGGVWAINNTAWGFIQWVIFNANMTSNEWTWLNGNFAGGTSLTNTFQKTVGNTFELFDVGFYLDSNITGIVPEFVVPHIEDDHRDCLRYWYRCTSGRGIASGTTVAYLYMPHFVPMRTTPNISVVGALRIYDGAAPNIASINTNACTSEYFGAVVNTAGLSASGRAVNILADSQNTNYIAVNARV